MAWVAKDDFMFVLGFIRREKSNRPGRSVEDLRIEAVKEQAKRRGVVIGTVHRNLKLFLNIDREKNIDAIDQLIEDWLEVKPLTVHSEEKT